MDTMIDLTRLWEDIVAGRREKLPDERIWLSDPKFAYLYAKYFRKERWSEEQEISICQDAKTLYGYSFWIKNVLGQRVPQHLINIFLMKSVEGDKGDKQWLDLFSNNIEKKSR